MASSKSWLIPLVVFLALSLSVPGSRALEEESPVTQIETDAKGKAYVVTEDGARWVRGSQFRSCIAKILRLTISLSREYRLSTYTWTTRPTSLSS